MNINSSFNKKTVEIDDRKFTVQTIRFDNGFFVSVTEDGEKLGAMVVSINHEPYPLTSTVIPAKTESFFLKLIAEKLSKLTKGITIISANFRKEISSQTTKILMNEIMEMIQNA